MTDPGEHMSAWQGTRTLVTGATGFIGSHLVRRLAGLGARVHAVSRRPQEATGHVECWHAADLCDAAATAALVEAVQPEVILHLASEVTGVREPGIVAPTLAGNLGAAVNLLTAVTGGPVRSVVLAGSVEEPREGQAPGSPYAAAKAAATGYARMFHALWRVPVSVLRVAMVYGPGEPNAARLVPYVTTSLLKGQAPRLTSGARLVTWVYVEDVVDAFVLAGAGGDAAGHILDIGTPEPVSIRDTAELLAAIVDGTVDGTVDGRARPEYGAVAARPLDRTQRSDIGPAERVLGWRPATTLEAGLRQTVAWYAKRM
ncbi:NAD(P)-dependent oxidoreductase [Nonomuraea sp. KC401]|uniref:NAD-dependent epimerase/dehydratase family protein n=1 Tax=unclassified Nonomuraea TaxID=2593643 RepID=UPI0010FD0862|nr:MULTISPECIES: NAD(P)-dependent oxidoreductase [unclassified Nonomuraea]NBE91729.1 NAD-dependent epimerase/dehydratase family protein [Nonomuraea sp. K271]TLF85815.1 NAD(P)-dependent oxidoreductase [Nonomuraea sp. KC401]